MLIGWDMSRYTNNYYGGKMDEMSLYSRAISDAEISAIYNVSAATTNRLIGKFDPTVTPAVGLAEALVTFGSSSSVIFGVNNQWSANSFTFTAATNSMPLQITGLQPGILLDAFAVSEAPETNLYYLPEQALEALAGSSAYGNWTLQVWDNRAGAYVTNNLPQLVNWQLSFVLESNALVSASLPPQTPVTTTVPSGQFVYYSVTVPAWAHFATNILVSSSQPVDLWFNQTNPPTGSSPGDIRMFNTPQTSGVGLPILITNGTPPLLPGQTYYLGVLNNNAHAAEVTLEVDYDILALTNGVPYTSVLTNEYDPVRYFAFDVSTNASEATFQLLKLSGNADLVVQRSVPLPVLTNSDYGSFNVGKLGENIYVVTNSSPLPLAAGHWYLGVFNRDSGGISYSVLAKELDPTNGTPAIIDLTNGVPLDFTAGPGAALTNFFRFRGTNFISGGVTNYMGVRFELYNLTGDGDLTVQTDAPPLAPVFFQSSQNRGHTPELILIYTNSALTNLAADWYLGVPNNEVTNINYTIIALMETNSYFPAFPGAVGAGGGAVGGGGPVISSGHGTNGTVYHVTSTGDSGFGTLRDAVSSTNRTMIFDVSGTINLLSPLVITNSYLTIAGQTAPGGGITVAGDMTAVQSAHDVIIRDVRFRSGMIDDSFQFLDASNVIADHISASWSANNLVSVLNSSNVTVQWSILADSLYDTNNPQATGSLLREGGGALSFHHNLYADNYSGSPRLGDNLTLDFVNNVIYNWGLRSGLTGGTNDIFDYSTNGCTNQLNYVCNYLIAGPDTANFATNNYSITNIAFFGGGTNALAANWIFQTNNLVDSDTNNVLNGADTGWGMFTNQYTRLSRAFPTPPVPVDEAFIAYERVLDFAGVNLTQRDPVDTKIVSKVRTQTGRLIAAPGNLPVLISTPAYLDTDQDGIPDFWEITFGQNPTNASNNQLSMNANYIGYTDLEEYLAWLAGPHALTVTNTSVGMDLMQLFGKTGNLSFSVTNGVNGTVYLTNVLGPVTYTGPLSNSIAVFMPTNSAAGGTNYYGYASFDVEVTNTDTAAYFGPVTVSVVVSAVPIAYANNTNSPPVLPNLTNQTINELTLLTVTNTATDANTNLTLTYTVTMTIDTAAMIANGWPLTNATIIPSPVISANGIITWTPSEAQGPGVYIITTVVSDNGAPPLFATNSFSVTVNEVNTAPVLSAQANQTINELTTLVVTNTATDSDLPPNPLTYIVTMSIDTNAMLANDWPLTNATIIPFPVISADGIITWTPSEAQGPGVYIITTIVTDTNAYALTNQSLTATNSFSVTVNEVNTAPVLPPQADRTINELTMLVVTNTATDSDLPPNLLTYQLIGPPGAVIDNNGIITWTPSEAQGPGVYLITTIVTDFNPYALVNQSLTATNNFTVTVNEVNTAPVLSAQANRTINELTTLVVTNTATDSDLPTNLLTYAVTTRIDTNAMNVNGWPLTYATTTPAPVISPNGVITWTPSEAQGPGVYVITTVVTDTNAYALVNQSLTATNSFSVTVNEVNTAPVLPAQANRTNAVLTTLVVTNTATDSDLPPNPLTYQLIGPAGAVIDTNGVITWTPTVAQATGLYTFTTIVTDTNIYALTNQSLSATNSFTVYVPGVAAPFVFTQPATFVTGTNAQLNGMATPNGLPATAWFEWGTDTLYGNQTPPGSVGAGYNVVYANTQISGLVANVPYHFRLVVSNAVAIVYGFDQILDEANVVVWGADYAGQANVPSGLSNVVAIAGAYDHSLALKNNGTAAAWGDNAFGQATVPLGLANLSAVVGGEYYSLALNGSGTVTAWGANILAQTNVPPGLNNVVAIAGGTYSSLALKNNGKVVAWGANFFNLTNVPASVNNIVAVAGGSYHSLAIRNDGTVAAWGDDSVGQTDVPAGLTNVVAIAGGNYHSLALKNDGTVVAWGDDSAGQTDVPAGLSNVVAVAAGGFHSLVLKNDGTVVAWGDPSAGQVNVPNGLNHVVAIAAGYLHSMVLTPQSPASFTNLVLNLTNGVPQTNSILAGGTTYYRVNVPVNADSATNLLLFTLNGPLNVWFTTNMPPTIAAANDTLLLAGVTNGSSILNTSNPPVLVPGNTYYLGVNNVHGFAITYGIEVDFHLVTSTNPPPVLPVVPLQIVNPLNALVVTNTATDVAVPVPVLTYVLTSTVVGTNVPVINATNGVITWTPAAAQWGTSNTLTTVVTAGGVPALSATNVFAVVVNPVPGIGSVTATNGGYLLKWYAPTNDLFRVEFTDGLPPVWQSFSNVVAYAGPVTATNGLFTFFDDGVQHPFTGLRFYRLQLIGLAGPVTPPPVLPVVPLQIVNPLNALVVTNTATDVAVPVPVLTYVLTSTVVGTNVPVINATNGVITWTPAAAQWGTSNTLTTVVTAGGVPALSATNVFAVVVNPVPGIGSVTATNGGYLLKWYAPTNDLFRVEFTDGLPPVWQSFSNVVAYAGPVTATNGLFTFFDDGVQHPFTGLRFYRLQLIGLAGPVTPPPVLPVVPLQIVNPLNALVVTNTATDVAVPVPVLTYVLTSTVVGTNVPVINATNGVITWTPAAAQWGTSNTLTTVVTAGGVPALSATNVFAVVVNPVPGIGSVTATNGGYLLKWYAPTNDLFRVEFTDGLPPVWQSFSNVVAYAGPVTATNGLFTFFDDGVQHPFTGLRFYRLQLIGLAGPVTPPPVLPVVPLQIVNPLNALVVTNTATDVAVPVPVLTYVLTSTVVGTNVPVINATNGVITWTPAAAQWGTSNTLTTVVTAGGVPALSATNVFAVVVNPVPGIGSVTATNGGYLLKWYAPTNDLFRVEFTDGLPPVWQSFSNVVAYAGPVTATNGLFTFFDDGVQHPFTGLRFYRLQLIGLAGPVTPPPVLPVVPLQIVNPLNALVVTNTATDVAVPVPVLTYVLTSTVVGTNVPVINATNGVITWTPAAAQWGTSNTLTTVVTAGGVPALSATNVFAVVVNPVPGIGSVTATNGGYLLKWYAPTNDLFRVEFTDGLPPVWQSFSNVVAYAGPVTATNGLFTFFDDGVQHPFTGLRFYRLQLIGLAGPVTPPPVLPVVPLQIVNPLNALVVTNTATDVAVPVPVLTYVLTSTVVGTNVPVINATNGVITWTPAAAQWGTSNTLTTVVTAGGVPALSATNVFAVVVNPVPGIGSVTATNGGYLLKWYAPTNDLFRVEFTDGLPPVWQSFSNVVAYAGPVTATNGLFTFFDDGVQHPFTGLRFYRLQLIGLAGPVTPPAATNLFSISISTNNSIVLVWSAPTNNMFRVHWTTSLVPPINWTLFPGTNTSTTGIFKFMDTNTPLLMKFYELVLLP